MPSKILNYTTDVQAKRTVTECHDVLAEAGASAITTLYTGKTPSGVQFQLDTPFGARLYRLPVNVEGVSQLIKKIDAANDWPAWVMRNPKHRARITTPEHALDVAWRIILAWLEAQMTLIEINGAEQVMLPYMMTSPDTTVFEDWKRHARAELEAGS